MTLEDLEILEIKTEPHHIDPYKHNGKWIKEEDIKADIIKTCKKLFKDAKFHEPKPPKPCNTCGQANWMTYTGATSDHVSRSLRERAYALMEWAGIKEGDLL